MASVEWTSAELTTTGTALTDWAAAVEQLGVPAVITAQTPWGRTVEEFRLNPGDWRRVSAHAEPAGPSYRGGVSIEEVYERASERLVRHRIFGANGELLHETFRPYAKFGGE